MREVHKELNFPVRIRKTINLAEFQHYPLDVINDGMRTFDLNQTAPISEDLIEYSHLATFHGIPCYFNIETEGFTGRSKFNCFMIDMLIIFGRFIPGIGAPSKIVIGAELEEDALYH